MTKIAAITGASRGIGRACALALAADGFDIALIGRNLENLETVAGEVKALNRNAFVLQTDATNLEQLKAVLGGLSRLDVLVNNVGTNIPEPFLEVTEAHYDQIFNLNLRTTFFATQIAVEKMLGLNNGGVIINISSQMGHVGAVNRSVYCASKHALEGLTKALAVELAPHKIRVVSVAPTFIETDLTRPMLDNPDFQNMVIGSIPLGHLGSPEDVAHAVAFLASSKASLITGTSLLVDGGWTAR
jgi:NAD(P)-dependent dehydrogenase (short-subunit alcohol dehydrogenase family)